jgi:hypothetical protein
VVTGTEDLLPVIDCFLKIPADGRVLGARLWRPCGAGRWPVIVEFSPYRIWDLFRGLGEITFPYWAERGYAVLTVDIAGSGGSTGVLHDEYLPGEIDDALAAIAWCAAQSWCDGNAGLSGLSWAAFTALRVADRKPPALKAMVLGGVSEDGWRTDIHYLGGVPYTAQVDWAGVMLMFNALPPDPGQFGEDWREVWKARLEANTPWIVPWLAHATHDTYWKDKAARFESEVPLLLYSGLADKYAASVLRIAERWRGPVRTIVGPWDHTLPNLSPREPRVGFLQEALQWWDKWLKGRDTGVTDDAPLRLWVGAPDKAGNTTEGHWRTLDWPLTNHAALYLDGVSDWKQLENGARSAPKLGADLYEDVPAPFDAPAASIVLQSEPQREDIDIVAAPQLHCSVKGDGTQIIARLLDIAPDGTMVRMMTGALALVSSAAEHEIAIPLQACAWRLKTGHRIALSLEGDGWPTFWSASGGIAVRNVGLSVPVAPAIQRDEANFAPPVTASSGAKREKLRWLNPAQETIAFAPRDSVLSHESTSAAHHLMQTGTDHFITSRFEVARDWAAKSTHVAFKRPGFSIRIDTRLEVSSTPKTWQIAWTIRATDSGRVIHDCDRQTEVPRV